jgi:hypothetical protein
MSGTQIASLRLRKPPAYAFQLVPSEQGAKRRDGPSSPPQLMCTRFCHSLPTVTVTALPDRISIPAYVQNRNGAAEGSLPTFER